MSDTTHTPSSAQEKMHAQLLAEGFTFDYTDPRPAHAVAHSYATTDAMIAAASHVDREYGSHGYRIGVATTARRRVYIFEVIHSDGSRFNIAADDWGNVQRLPDEFTARALALDAMSENANAI